MPLKTLIIDDSLIFRSEVRGALKEIDDVELVGFAANGEEAVRKIRSLKPDVVTLDVEMPGLTGLEVLETIASDAHKPAVIMLSSLTRSGAAATTKALACGALDFILKPQEGSVAENSSELFDKLSRVITSLKNTKRPATINLRGNLATGQTGSFATGPGTLKTETVDNGRNLVSEATKEPRSNPIDAICIGISTGGPAALNQLVPQIPADLPVPIFLVQHMPAMFTSSLAESLDAIAKVDVLEATNGMGVEAGKIYIAPGGRQMKVRGLMANCQIEINDDAPVRSCRPSVDYLLQSAAIVYRSRMLAIVMTGMGVDGVEGCRTVDRYGGMIWTQSESTCTVYGMPRAVVKAGLSQRSLSLNQFGDEIRRAARLNTSQSPKTMPTIV